jgi:hypothetical protein
MVKLVWTKLATKQLERDVKYVLAEQGLFYATIVYKGIIEKVDVLETHPLIGQKEPLLKHKKKRIQICNSMELYNNIPC